ncbi:MAG: RnfABCDGE type electron transport complex subunit B [Planctomycetota bacterium]
MDLLGIAATVLGLGILGLIFGIVLAVAAQKFHVETDPRIDTITSMLPGANCGGCGFPGCSGYAAGIVLQSAPLNKCSPGGSETSKKIAEVMGQSVQETERLVAVVACRGTAAVAKNRFQYEGISDCRSAHLVNAGFKACSYGCLGFGTCEKACPFAAIVKGEDGLPIIVEENCKACGKCVEACPRSIIQLAPFSKHVHVLCKSRDKGAATKKACSAGCIGCKKCEKVCKFEAIKIENNLAVIDYSKCKNCGKCVTECPQNVIVNFRKFRSSKDKAKAGKAKTEEQKAAA